MKQYEIPSLALTLISKLNSMRQTFGSYGEIDNYEGQFKYSTDDFEVDLEEQLQSWMIVVDNTAQANHQLHQEVKNLKEINSIHCERIVKQKQAIKSRNNTIKNLKIKLEKAILFPKGEKEVFDDAPPVR